MIMTIISCAISIATVLSLLYVVIADPFDAQGKKGRDKLK